MQQFNAPGSETSSISLKNPERVSRKEEAEGVEGSQEQEAVVREQKVKRQTGQKEDKRFEGEGGKGVLY